MQPLKINHRRLQQHRRGRRCLEEEETRRKAEHVMGDDVERPRRHRSESCKKSRNGPEWSLQLQWDGAIIGCCLFGFFLPVSRYGCVYVTLLETKLNFLII